MQTKIKNKDGEVIWVFWTDACKLVDVQPLDAGTTCRVDILMGKQSKTILLEIDYESLLEQLPTENLNLME
jgi:hypothetical protein